MPHLLVTAQLLKKISKRPVAIWIIAHIQIFCWLWGIVPRKDLISLSRRYKTWSQLELSFARIISRWFQFSRGPDDYFYWRPLKQRTESSDQLPRNSTVRIVKLNNKKFLRFKNCLFQSGTDHGIHHTDFYPILAIQCFLCLSPGKSICLKSLMS